MSLKSIPPLPKQGKQHPEIQKLPRGVISKGAWEKKTFTARKFKKDAK